MKFTFEADLARNSVIDYNTAIQRTYLTRTRFELAKPYSVIVLGHAHGWYYGEGVLSYPLGDLIRILDVYNAAVTEDVIDVRSLLNGEAERWPQHTQGIRQLLSRDLYIDMMDYGEGILLIDIKDSYPVSGYLVVINIRKGISLQERLLMIRRYSSGCKAMTDGRYMIVCEDPESNGNLELYDLEDKQQGIQKRHLPEYIGYAEAQRQIYDGRFYLFTNTHSHRDDTTVEYWDHTYVYSFPLNQFSPVTSYCAAGTEPLPEQLQVVRVKRPQRRTRQNHDRDEPWSTLELCLDEYSGHLAIVEGWHHNGEEDDAANAQYTFQPLPFPEPDSAIDTATPDLEFFFGSVVQTLNPANLSRAEKDCECPRDPGDRLKARSYVPWASTFLDVYLGSDENPDSRQVFGLRLAVGSYHRASPNKSETGQLEKVSPNKLGGSPADNNERQFVGVRRFPPNGAPPALFDLLCPTGKPKWPNISCADQRTILYSTKRLHRKFNDTAEQLVLINFDPWIRFPGLKPMVLDPASTQLTPREYENELARARKDRRCLYNEEIDAHAEKREAKQAKIDEMNKAEKAGKVWEPRSPWFWTEPAMYLDIHQGFQFKS